GPIEIVWPEKLAADDSMILPPAPEGQETEIERGPNIAPLPRFKPPPETREGPVMLRLGDNVTTDDILPAGAHILALRSNIPAISRYIFHNVDPSFPDRQREAGSGFVVAGANYGQGSSREHAALAPRFLGLSGVVAASFARIHKANLCNFGIWPLEFLDPAVLGRLRPGHSLVLPGIGPSLGPGAELDMSCRETGETFRVKIDVSARQLAMLLAGGLLALEAGRRP
ncbi:MAG: aconitate hydratase, partial [Deltaproteobacteria bacterium]|nr:aconitate hydratase [Deltaproteobacteria bacterium]